MARKNCSMQRKFGSGLLAGGLIGLILGLLFAPKSGMETREQLKEANEKYRGKANEELKASFDRLSDRIKPLLQQTVSDMPLLFVLLRRLNQILHRNAECATGENAAAHAGHSRHGAAEWG